MSTPSLFPQAAKSRFMTITLSRYNNLCARHEGKKLPPPPFTVEQLRDQIYRAMGDRYDGALKCRYCGRVCDLSEVELDHAVPIARGGGLGLSNIDLPCADDNAFKGPMTPEECMELLTFLRTKLPGAYQEIYQRLKTWGGLAASKRKAEMLLRNEGMFPEKKKKVKPPLVRAIDEAF